MIVLAFTVVNALIATTVKERMVAHRIETVGGCHRSRLAKKPFNALQA